MLRTYRTQGQLSDEASRFLRCLTKIGLLIICCSLTSRAFGQEMKMTSVAPEEPSQSTHRHDDSGSWPKTEVANSSTAVEKGPGVVTIGQLQIAIPDLIVLDQHGTKRRFYSDLIKDKIVILSFFFTSCVSSCPAMSLALSRLQTNLGTRLGKDVFIITVTRDPVTDNPQRLMAWGNKIGVKPGWTMVTGEQEVIGQIVRRFTGDRLGQDAHTTIFIIGSDKTGNWTEASGFTTPAELTGHIEMVTKTNDSKTEGHKPVDK